MHGEVHISVHACTNDYLRCTIDEVHDRVRISVIRCTKKSVPKFLILEALKFVSRRARVSGEFDSGKDSQSTNIERRPQIFVKLSFRELCGSKLSGLHPFDNMAIIH